jgi:NAD(P)-dependent dehydrogenase (short-subunit alcohol dehydrogenase family)
MGELQDKVAIVTGGGSGIGAAIARRFAAEGARLVLAGRRREPIERVAREIDALAVVSDVALEAEVAALVATCRARFGRLDVLVPNAGVGGGGLAPTAAIDVETWDRTFAVNTRGVMLCVKHAVPLLTESRGSVVVVASTSGLRPNPMQAAYAASKAATLAFVKAAAQELGPSGVRVNALCPGAVDTELYRANAAARVEAAGRTIDDDKARLADLAALRRIATAEDIAAAALFLATGASGAMTGEYLKLDCGRV